MGETGAEHVEDDAGEPNASEHRAIVQFLEASTQLHDALNRMLLEEHKLSLFDVLLLDLLAKSDGGSARIGELAESLTLLLSRVSQQVSRLELQGLVRRSASRSDRRGVIATITRDGEARLKRAMRTYALAVRTYYLNPLSRQQMTALGDSCRRISTGLKPSGPEKRSNTD